MIMANQERFIPGVYGDDAIKIEAIVDVHQFDTNNPSYFPIKFTRNILEDSIALF